MTKHADTFGGALAGTWRQAVGAWASSSGAVQCADVQGATGKYLIDDSTDVGSSDMYSELRIGSTQVNSGSNTGPAIRHRASVVTGYQFSANLTTDSHGAWRTVAGAETQLGTFTAAVALNDMLRIEAAGRTLRYKVNDALVFLLQDTTITDGQRGGINGYNAAASGDLIRADDFETGALTDDLVAPYIAEWTPQVEGATSGAVITPSFTDVRTGDEALVHVVTRDAAVTVTAPAGEGWSASVQTPSQTGLRTYVFAKRWGLGGQTDDTTPTFTISTGTSGWVAAGLVIRNPLHATLPWATATQAIVASGSQSNAAAATATAPSVSYVGTHVSVLRLYSSADDNALNAPSAGALIYGGAAYDSTQGNDQAQAASIVEDVTLAANTGTATVTESLVGNDISNGITLVLAIPSASLSTATETDTAVGIVLAGKSQALGAAAAETDAARPLVFASKTTTVATTTETDTAPALAASSKTTVVAAATEAESALALAGASHTTLLAAGQETDTGPALAGAQKTAPVGVASETSAAEALAGASKHGAVGQATSAEQALALAGAVKATDVGAAHEVDTVPALGALMGVATETDSVPALAGAGHMTEIGTAGSTEQALPLAGAVKTAPVGVAAEVDEVHPLIVLAVPPRSQGGYSSGADRLVYNADQGRAYDRGSRYVYDP